MAVGTGNKKSFSRGKRILIGLNVAVMILVFAGLYFGICYLASLSKFRTRVDLTQDQAFTLSPLTLSLLDSLDKEVEVISIFHRPYQNNPGNMFGREIVEKEIGDYTALLLQEYAIHSGGRIKLEILDRDRDNLRVGELYQQIGFNENTNVVIFLCGNNRKDLFAPDMATYDGGGVDPATNVIQLAKLKSYHAEAAITGTILSVIEESKPKAYFTTGRKESGIQDQGPDGIFFAAEVLRQTNFEVAELKLFSEPVVPDDCSVLIIAGPRDNFSEEEVAAVRTYLHGGGQLLLALSPLSSDSLETILPDFNIGLDRSITTKERLITHDDRSLKAFFDAKGFSAESPITRSISEASGGSVFYKTGAVNRADDDLNVEELVWSPSDTWGDTHGPGEEGNYFLDSDKEVMGPRVLGVSCAGIEGMEETRLVFFAATHFYTNNYVRKYPANMDLFKNSVNWLAAREHLLEIPPRTPFVSRVDLTPDEYNDIGIYVVLYIPCAAILLGLVVWRLRRR